MLINYVVEGRSDTGFAERLIEYSGHAVGKAVVKRGVSNLDRSLRGYRNASKYASNVGWLVLRDSDGQCPVTLRNALVPSPEVTPLFALRIVVTMSEAWALADADAAAKYFRIPRGKIPRSPEETRDPKRALLQLVSAHAPRPISEDMVKGASDMGPLFAVRMVEYAQTIWDIEKAAESSDSLRRAIASLRAMSIG